MSAGYIGGIEGLKVKSLDRLPPAVAATFMDGVDKFDVSAALKQQQQQQKQQEIRATYAPNPEFDALLADAKTKPVGGDKASLPNTKPRITGMEGP